MKRHDVVFIAGLASLLACGTAATFSLGPMAEMLGVVGVILLAYRILGDFED